MGRVLQAFMHPVSVHLCVQIPHIPHLLFCSPAPCLIWIIGLPGPRPFAAVHEQASAEDSILKARVFVSPGAIHMAPFCDMSASIRGFTPHLKDTT